MPLVQVKELLVRVLSFDQRGLVHALYRKEKRKSPMLKETTWMVLLGRLCDCAEVGVRPIANQITSRHFLIIFNVTRKNSNLVFKYSLVESEVCS